MPPLALMARQERPPQQGRDREQMPPRGTHCTQVGTIDVMTILCFPQCLSHQAWPDKRLKRTRTAPTAALVAIAPEGVPPAVGVGCGPGQVHGFAAAEAGAAAWDGADEGRADEGLAGAGRADEGGEVAKGAGEGEAGAGRVAVVEKGWAVAVTGWVVEGRGWEGAERGWVEEGRGWVVVGWGRVAEGRGWEAAGWETVAGWDT